jgi:restriction endonuclease Mrr
MDPRQFEELVCNLFRQMGYLVEGTPYVGDGGADGYLYKDGQKTILQCKRVKGSVGEPVLRDLYGTMYGNDAQLGLVVTTGRVSHPAKKWANGKSIRIIELDELRTLLEENFPSSVLVPPDFAPKSTAIHTVLDAKRSYGP